MKVQYLSTTLLTIWANLALTHAFYGPRDDVVELTPRNFKTALLDTNHLVAVEFYAPWCGHCQRLAPEWKKAATNLKGLVSVAAINCDEDNNKGLCAQYDIKGFPTIKVFSPELRKNKRTGELTKSASDYQGPRDAKSIVDHLLSYQPSQVLFVKWNEKDVKSKKSISLDNFLNTKNETLPKALLFTNKPTTTPLYKALSIDFKDKMLVGEVKSSEKNIIAEFGIQSFPTLLVISPEHGSVQFEGKLNHQNLKEFMKKYALSSPSSEKQPPVKSAVKEPKPVVALEDNDSFAKSCLKASTSTICIVAITNQDDKQDTVDMLNTLRTKFTPTNGLDFQFAWLYADQSQSITNSLQVPQDSHSIFFLRPSKQLYRNYIGSWSEQNLLNWLNQINTGRIQAWPYKDDLKVDLKPVDEPIHDEL
ncbi:hypothetical protein EDC96DRAFT_548709 [Choanephora cucurbitarum]|nr:hypothetical protein EDC96DRAFT_548709 [Choanephora cucurbitarum]